MQTGGFLAAAGDTDRGLQREVNEDRFHVDVPRGLFVVVDGIGGQAAGGKAADVALTMIRARMERETGPTAERVREAITIANNEIHRVASMRPEWHGMACVLSVAVVGGHVATIGHVGDTRLYKLHGDRIEKITRDHSPVGEREDANEISEVEAMHHPRRNEVYRDVGSEPHQPADPDFIELRQIPFESDEALLLCSDGLTDLVESTSINHIVTRLAGRPDQVVQALIGAANDRGGKDNVTAVYVEGDQFAAARAAGRPLREAIHGSSEARDHRRGSGVTGVSRTAGAEAGRRRIRSWQVARMALVALLAAGVTLAVVRWRPNWPLAAPGPLARPASTAGIVVVQPTESIDEALSRLEPGPQVVQVEPGEYREQVVLKSHVRLFSRVPRGATIRLPGTASEADPAVIAAGISDAEFIGFRIVGDAATPLGTGVLVDGAQLSIVDVEISGAVRAAIDFNHLSKGGLLGSDIHDNPGTALAIRAGASPRIAHNVFVRNGLSERAWASLLVEDGAEPSLTGNVFQGVSSKLFGALSEEARQSLMRENWFPDATSSRPPPAASARGRQGR